MVELLRRACANATPYLESPRSMLDLRDGGWHALTGGAAGGRPVVVNLWAGWCGPCRQEMPTLAAAQRREVLLDPGSKLGPAIGSRGLPTTLFYDAQGKLVDAHFGVLNPPALESRLRALRATR